MDLKWFKFCILMQTVLHLTGVYVVGIILLPMTIDVLEGSEVNLTCLDKAQDLIAVRWRRNSEETAMERKGTLCEAYYFLNDRNLYSYFCNSTIFSVLLKNISREANGDKWQCLNKYLKESNVVTIFVKVPVETVILSPIQNVFTTEENETLSSLQSASSKCRPEPVFRWYKDRDTNSREDDILLWEDKISSNSSDILQTYISTFEFTPNRTWNGWYTFCVATNTINGVAISDKILLNITYPPEDSPRIIGVDDGDEYIVIEGNFVNLTCSVKGGHPLPQLEWNRDNNLSQTITDNTVTKAIFWQAFRSDQGALVCTSKHLHKNETTSVRLTVLPAVSHEDVQGVIATVSAVAGGVVVLLVTFIAVVCFSTRSQRSKSYSLRHSRDVEESRASQNSQADANRSSLDGGNSNVYEELQDNGDANYSSLDGGNQNMNGEHQNAVNPSSNSTLRTLSGVSHSTLVGGRPNIYEEIRNPGWQ